MRNLSKDSKTTRVINATAAGVTAVNGSTLDMAGFDAVEFTAMIGALSATQVTGLKAQVGQLANGTDMADLTGAATAAMADGDSNKCLILDVVKPSGYRYIRCVVTRGTANAVIDGVLAKQYATMNKPTTQDAGTVSQTKFVVAPTP